MATVIHPVVARRRFSLRGIVQGVGFRPFVYHLAQRIGVRGFVLNTSSGVIVEAEGPDYAVNEFARALRTEAPVRARIEEVTATELQPVGETHFTIRDSETQAGEFVLVSPDVTTCDACWRDVTESENRRFGYPFTNCTNCGPRYTIIRDIPYDRPATTMAAFGMCPACEAEYHDPANRRFHAQPNACHVCGPTVALAKSGSFFPSNGCFGFGGLSLSVIADARDALREGAIVAVKGLGGFQLACDAENEAAVRQLRSRKKRSDKPFALMVRDIASAEQICLLSVSDRELLLSAQRPIVILPRRRGTKLSSDIAPGNDTVGVMLAYTPLHYFLFGEPDSPPEFTALVMTSGNISDEPIVTSNEEAWQRLGNVADWLLFHNRDIYMRVDDSVARTFDGRSRVLRRSRGYAPQPIDLGLPMQELLACGGELKNTFCVTKGTYAILSQHIGDIENYETLEFFHETLNNMKKLFRVEPQAVAHDLHPMYLTTRLASELPLPKIAVQHHHAHIASCMAENGLRDKVIGVAFDGTGYGTDGQIWGGEFLIADFAGFERRAHFRYVLLPGGDTAVRQPWRSALSWLHQTFASEIPADLPIFDQVADRNTALVSQMIARGISTVQTSSCGRLFDAVASLIGIRQEATFEGQAAIELEVAAHSGTSDDVYSFDITSNVPAEIDMRPMFREIVLDLQRGQAKSDMSRRFHNTIAAIIAEVCRQTRDTEHLNRVCLSGGTFQNMYLLERAVRLLRHSGFEVFLHSAVPPNDGGISLGQAVIANEILKSGA